MSLEVDEHSTQNIQVSIAERDKNLLVDAIHISVRFLCYKGGPETSISPEPPALLTRAGASSSMAKKRHKISIDPNNSRLDEGAGWLAPSSSSSLLFAFFSLARASRTHPTRWRGRERMYIKRVYKARSMGIIVHAESRRTQIDPQRCRCCLSRALHIQNWQPRHRLT
jgi:hypothetical protein